MNPADILRDDRLDVFQNFPSIIPTERVPLNRLRPCHRVQPGKQKQLFQILLKREVAVLLPKEHAVLDAKR